MRSCARGTALAISLILLAAAPAAAETPVLPEEFSAADQYVESVPTSSGPKPAGKQKSKPPREQGSEQGPAPVPAAVDELDGTLKEVATSPDLGAPERALPDARAGAPSVPSATVSAIDEAEENRLLWLVLALVVVSGAIAGTAIYRQRAHRRAPRN